MITNPEVDEHVQQSAFALETLGREISAATKIVTSFLQGEGTIPSSSDQVLAGSCSVPHHAPAKVVNAKRTLFEATTSLQQLLLSPTDFHLHATLDLQRLVSYRWLINFNIPDLVPLEAAVTYASIAASAHVPEDQLMRLARLAMTGGLFHEPTTGHIAHTPLSAGLRTPSPVRDTMLFLTETNLPTATKIVQMTQSQVSATTDTSTTAPTAFQLAHNTTLPFFPYLSTQPQIASRLAAGMRTLSAASESHVSHLLVSYPWSSLPTGTTILDLGGSRGHISISLATQLPHLRFIVQDLPGVIASATTQPLPPAVQGRVTFQAHSFLDPQPAANCEAADVALVRQCLNNWPHRDALRVLRALLPWLEAPIPDGKQRGCTRRVLINNVVVPVPFSTRQRQQQGEEGRGEVEGESESYGHGMRDEAIARVRDVAMLQLMDGAERDLTQWESLLREADPRLRILGVSRPEGSLLSLLDVRLDGKGEEEEREKQEEQGANAV